MKTPSFWYDTENEFPFSPLFLPLGFLYRALGQLRRAFTKPFKAEATVICVGNIVAGGAGKTPTVLALTKILKASGANPVALTRGYGGKEKGPLQVMPNHHTALDVGDEALLLAEMTPCWIGRDRAKAAKQIGKTASHIVMDDGLQNPSLFQDISLLVIDGESGLGNRRLIPAGPLREKLSDALPRIHAIVMIGDDIHNICAKTEKPILKAKIVAHPPKEYPNEPEFFAFTGIGRPEKFYKTCKDIGLTLTGIKSFADHHVFTKKELDALLKAADDDGSRLLTTQKDWMRLPEEFRKQVSVLPIELVFDDEEMVKKILNLK